MKVIAAIATVAPGKSTDSLSKQTAVVLGNIHHAGFYQYWEKGRR